MNMQIYCEKQKHINKKKLFNCHLSILTKSHNKIHITHLVILLQVIHEKINQQFSQNLGKRMFMQYFLEQQKNYITCQQ